MSLFFTIHGSWRAGVRIRHGQRRYLQPYNAHMLQSVSERLKLSMCVGRDTEVQLPITRSHVGSCSFVLKKNGGRRRFLRYSKYRMARTSDQKQVLMGLPDQSRPLSPRARGPVFAFVFLEYVLVRKQPNPPTAGPIRYAQRMGYVSARLGILPHTFLKWSLFWSSSATLDRATSRYTRPLDIVSVLAERHGQGGSTPQALYDPYPFLKLPEPRKVKTWFSPSGRPRGPAYPVGVKKKLRPFFPGFLLGVGPGATPGPGQHSAGE